MDRLRVERSSKVTLVGAVPAIERWSVMPPMGTMFRNSAVVSDADRAAIDAILSSLPLKFPTFLDMEWNPEDRSLLDVYTGYMDLPRCGGSEVITLRRAGDAWQVVEVTVWAA